MTAEQVIKLGQEIEKTSLSIFTTHPGIVLACIGLFLLGLALFAIGYEKNHFNVVVGIGCMSLCVVGFSIFDFITSAQEINLYHSKKNEWIKNVAQPYIDSLEKEVKEIERIEMKPGPDHKYNVFEVYFKDTEEKMTGSFELIFSPYVKSPYFEFQRLTVDLGHGMDAGIYNGKIYVPLDYDIKKENQF